MTDKHTFDKQYNLSLHYFWTLKPNLKKSSIYLKFSYFSTTFIIIEDSEYTLLILNPKEDKNNDKK